MIYKTFEQWMNGNFLEVKEPRKKAYSKDELLLVEMGWSYGYDAGRAVEQALDKKAENARALGLDYEPVADFDDTQVQTVYNILCDADEGKPREEHWEGWKARQIVAALTTPPAAQRQWVGLTFEDQTECLSAGVDNGWRGVMEATEAKLKEKNNG